MLDHRPNKRFGQNFLRDPQIVARILAAAALTPADRVLEIGPGLGALTDRLLPVCRQVVVMELDHPLVERWRARTEPNLQVCAGDAVRLDWPALLPEPPYKLVANLPYNISSQIVFKLLDHRALFSGAVLMFQKEVADRLCAAPGGKDYGILSVLCQLYFDLQRVVVVPPGAFTPPPKVYSAVLALTPLAQPRVAVQDAALLRRVVKGAFGQRRKTLRNALTGAGFDDAAVALALQGAQLDGQRRGETLTLGEFARLSDAFSGLQDLRP